MDETNFIPPPTIAPVSRKRPVLDPPSNEPIAFNAPPIQPINAEMGDTQPSWASSLDQRPNGMMFPSVPTPATKREMPIFCDDELRQMERLVMDFRGRYLNLSGSYHSLQQEFGACRSQLTVAEHGWETERGSVQRAHALSQEIQKRIGTIWER